MYLFHGSEQLHITTDIIIFDELDYVAILVYTENKKTSPTHC